MDTEAPVPSAAGPPRSYWWQLAAIAVAALVVRWVVVLVVDPSVPALGDASAYHRLANLLADGRGYLRPFDLSEFGRVVPTAEYPPLHPFVVSLFARIGVRSVEGQRLALSLVGVVTVVLVGELGHRLVDRRVGLVAAALAAVSPMMFLPETTLMSETVFVALVTMALLLAVSLMRRPSVGLALGVGAVAGLAALTRAEALVLGVLLFLPLLVPSRTTSLGRGSILVLVGVVTMVAVVAPWTIRNQATFHRFVPVSNNLGTALAGANCDLTYSGPSLGSWRSTFAVGDAATGECFTGFNGRRPGFNEAVAAVEARRQGLDYAREHVARWPVVAAARVLRTFGVFRPAQQIELETLEGRPHGLEQLGTWLEWALYPLAIGGGILLVRRRRDAWPLAASVVSVVVASVVTYGNQRFRIGAEPAILVAAATGLVTLFGRSDPVAAADLRDRRHAPVE